MRLAPTGSHDPLPAPRRSVELEGRTILIVRACLDAQEARRLVERWPEHGSVVRGDGPWYWVVATADVATLERAGYLSLDG